MISAGSSPALRRPSDPTEGVAADNRAISNCHDARNALARAIFMVEDAIDLLPDDAEARPSLEKALDEIERTAALIGMP
jgi:hypothetical protein